jgi:hypothetical protein
VITADDLRLRELRQLCEQAERLRKDAERLCKQIAAQIERSRAAHRADEPPRHERRRSKR